ncbi:MAG: S26 family signal peptidase, partial [Alphaproteobacteria bacterium]|nr:S26 family signal peptidase [Alphaproteobacteria bacterium]
MISLRQLKEVWTRKYIPKPTENLDFDKLKVPLPLRFSRSPGSRKSSWLGYIYQICLLGFGLVVIFEGITRTTGLALNQSDSLPQKVFLILKGRDLSRGHYLSFKNAWFKAPLIKEVIGIEGDKIIIDEQGEIWIARKVGKPLSHSKDGKFLHSITPG